MNILNRFLSILIFSIIPLLPSISHAQTNVGADEKYILRWTPEMGTKHWYQISTSGTKAGADAVRTGKFIYEIVNAENGITTVVAVGEPIANKAPLAYRLQRSLFPNFPFEVDEFGNTKLQQGQPFPLFINIPVFPKEELGVGSEWSGGPVGIIPDPNVGLIPFSYKSKLKSIEEFRGEKCAVIETDYFIALSEDAKSIIPFLGLVEGDESDEKGKGAVIGGIVENSPAHKAGIEPGDLVVSVQGQKIRGWSGLEEILPVLVPGIPVRFSVIRGEKKLYIDLAPEGIPLAAVTGQGGLHSICHFGMKTGLPMKIDLISKNLEFSFTNAEGESWKKQVEFHIMMEYLHGT